MADTEETIEAWITSREEATRHLLDLIDFNPGDAFARRAEATLTNLHAIREILAKAAKYADLCARNSENARSPTKRLRTRERNMEMAREFNKRAVRRAGLGTNRSDLALMTEVGRLPQFNLKRSAAHIAINAGLVELGRVPTKAG